MTRRRQNKLIRVVVAVLWLSSGLRFSQNLEMLIRF